MKWLIFIIFALSLNSCISTYPTMSYTTSQNVPLLENKNEMRLSAATGSQLYGFQGAYAFTNSLAVMGSYSNGLTFDHGADGTSDIRKSGEFAVGYFKSNENSIFEIYGGAERYYRSFTFQSSTDQAGTLSSDIFTTNGTMPFVQLDAAQYNTGHHSFAGSFRLGYVIYDNFSYTHFAPYGAPNTYQTSSKSTPILEPCITYRLGLRALSFQAQTGFTFQAPVTMYDSPINFFINAGLTWRLFGH